MTQIKDTFSMAPKEIENGKIILQSMVKDLSDKFPKMKKPPQDTAQSQPISMPLSQVPQPVSAPPAQSSAVNLQQQQQQQLNKVHQRSGSRGGSHAPVALTSSQPPFEFNAGLPPPNGVPAYIGKSTITRESLHLPAKKRQKQETNTKATISQRASGTNASPSVAKAVSPEMKRSAETK